MKASIDVKKLEELLDAMMAERKLLHEKYKEEKDHDNSFIQFGMYLGLFTAKNNLWQVIKYESEELPTDEKEENAKLSLPDNYGTPIFT